MADLSPLVGLVGAVTGIISLIWHMLNSRPEVTLERVYFTKADRHTHKVTIDTKAIIRNKGNRATTIENVYFEFGNHWIPLNIPTIEVKPNSSYELIFSRSIKPEEFIKLLENKSVKLGINVEHTFGMMKKHGYTSFRTPWLNI